MKKTKMSDWRIVRTYSAGVFFCKIKTRKGQEAVILNARRLWYWSGAASLSELAVSGVKNKSACKFSVPVATTELTGVIEVLHCTDAAAKNIQEVPEWKA